MTEQEFRAYIKMLNYTNLCDLSVDLESEKRNRGKLAIGKLRINTIFDVVKQIDTEQLDKCIEIVHRKIRQHDINHRGSYCETVWDAWPD